MHAPNIQVIVYRVKWQKEVWNKAGAVHWLNLEHAAKAPAYGQYAPP